MPSKKLPNNALIPEILQKVSNAKTKEEKVSLLREYNSQGLRSVLIINFDETLQFLLPEGDVPYNKNEAPIGTEHTRLDHEFKKFYRFFKGGDGSLNSVKREQLFIGLLESLHYTEADTFILACNKNLQEKYRITKAVVSEAFPQIQWGNRG
jgi:hypothetical protein